MNEQTQLNEALHFVKSKIKTIPTVAIILGSGLGTLADEIENKFIIDCRDIPHYPVSTVADHAGIWVIGELKKVPVLALKGRVHTYEGYSARKVTFSIRLMAKLGINRLIVTNASGAVNANFQPGDLMLIEDHINFMFDNPLVGDNCVAADQRFVDMFEAYDKTFIKKTKELAKRLKIPLKSGVLLTSKGPTYETAAEIRMARILGADAATMSTVPEVIAAKQKKLRVLGISCITNMATGITGERLSHEEVQQTAYKIKHQFAKLVKEILYQISEW